MKNTEKKVGLIDRINEDLFFMRKDFGMYAQVNFEVTAITGGSLLVKIWTYDPEIYPWEYCNSISNGIINLYQNILPIQSIISNFYLLEEQEVVHKEQRINYYPFKFIGHKCHVVLIEEY